MDQAHPLQSDPASGTAPIIELRDVTKMYKLGHRRIQALSIDRLTIQPGEFIAIVGTSGSGKSTLLQVMGGLDSVSSGSITVQGRLLKSLSDRALSRFRNRVIGFVFQFFYLQPYLSLGRNIEVAAMPRRTKRHERHQRVVELAQQVGLEERLDHLPRELSGGQIQRAAIARALINNPAIIIADEPTGNLDSANSNDVIALFRRLCDSLGTTVIIATHDHEIASQADRTITLRDGVIV